MQKKNKKTNKQKKHNNASISELHYHMFNKLMHIGSAQGYTHDMQVIMKYCYISMCEVENEELIQIKDFYVLVAV
jgi:hypothetical protein